MTGMTSHRSRLSSATLRNLLVIGASVPVLALPLFGLWVHRFLKDYRTAVHAAAFVIALGVVMHVGIFQVRERSIRFGSAAWRGAIAGYLAGLVAYFVMVLSTPVGIEGLSGVFGRDPGNSVALILGFPLFLGGWLYGALVGVAIEWLRARSEVSRSP